MKGDRLELARDAFGEKRINNLKSLCTPDQLSSTDGALTLFAKLLKENGPLFVGCWNCFSLDQGEAQMESMPAELKGTLGLLYVHTYQAQQQAGGAHAYVLIAIDTGDKLHGVPDRTPAAPHAGQPSVVSRPTRAGAYVIDPKAPNIVHRGPIDAFIWTQLSTNANDPLRQKMKGWNMAYTFEKEGQGQDRQPPQPLVRPRLAPQARLCRRGGTCSSKHEMFHGCIDRLM
jgi:hypothetical protein